MNRDDVLSAAREAGFNVGRNNINGALFSLTRFADIIEQRARKDEREACVKRFIDAVMSAHKFDDIVSRGADAIRDMQESGGGE